MIQIEFIGGDPETPTKKEVGPFFIMNLLSFLFFSFLGFFSFNDISTTSDGVESVVIQCGNDPDGNWDCVRMEFDDGSDCLVIVNEGADTVYHGC